MRDVTDDDRLSFTVIEADKMYEELKTQLIELEASARARAAEAARVQVRKKETKDAERAPAALLAHELDQWEAVLQAQREQEEEEKRKKAQEREGKEIEAKARFIHVLFVHVCVRLQSACSGHAWCKSAYKTRLRWRPQHSLLTHKIINAIRGRLLEKRREKKLAAKSKADAQRQKAKAAKAALEAEHEAQWALNLKMRIEHGLKREELAEEDKLKTLIKQQQQPPPLQPQQEKQEPQQQQEDLDDIVNNLPLPLPSPLPLSPSPPSLPSLSVPPPSSLSLTADDKTQATEESPKDGLVLKRHAKPTATFHTKRHDVSPPYLSPNVKESRAPEGQAVPPPPQTCISSGNARPPQVRL